MYGDEPLMFYNYVMDRAAMRRMIGRLVLFRGSLLTSLVLDQVKALGFEYATRTGISLGIDDLLASPSREWLVQDAEHQARISEEGYEHGCLHAVESLRQLVETWHTTSEFLKREMSRSFDRVDLMNPVHMMSFSGARGSTSQVHQLIGMRGLMSDPQGRIIDLPIQTNLREGSSLTEYIISCYGARKGVVDTAIRTADAGYLTRRLVEVAQHLMIGSADCGTSCGIHLHTIQDHQAIRYVLYHDRLLGRVLAQDICVHGRCVATRNQDVGGELASHLVSLSEASVLVRSPLTCKSMRCVCQLCYGWSTNYGKLVRIGEAIGVIAGQSIGEPGTQLTLRTFHTGGVFTGELANYVRAPFNGTVRFDSSACQPTRTNYGRPAWRSVQALTLVIRMATKTHSLTIPSNSLIVVAEHQHVSAKQVVAEIRATRMPFTERVQKHLYSDLQGQILYRHRVRCLHRPNAQRVRFSGERLRTNSTGHIWILACQLSDTFRQPVHGVYQVADHLQIGSPIATTLHPSPGQAEAAAPLLGAAIQWSAMLSHTERVRWRSALRQMAAGIALETQVSAALSGTICSLMCASVGGPGAGRCAMLSSVDQCQFVLQHSSDAPLTKPSCSNSAQQALGRARARESACAFNASKQRLLRFTTLRQAGGTSCHSTDGPPEWLGLMREREPLTEVRSEAVTLGAVGCAQRCVSHAGVSCVQAGRQAAGLLLPTTGRSELSRTSKWHRIREDGLQSGIGHLISNECVPMLSRLARSLRQAYRLPRLGRLLCPGLVGQCWQPPAEFGRVTCIAEIALVLRSVKCHLVVTGTQVYGYCHEAIDQQEALITLYHEQLRASDIIQGLPKAEQLLEARFTDELVSQFEQHWGACIDSLLHLVQPHILSAEKSLQSIQLELVDRIQTVYLAQGVRVSDRHVEVVVRRMSRVMFVQGRSPVRLNPALLPGELVELERARSIGSVFQVIIEYKPVLLGITKTSLNADSFLAAASFQQVTRVLSTAAFQGRTDWIQGLQENVIFGGFIPAGTGCAQIARLQASGTAPKGLPKPCDRLVCHRLNQHTAPCTLQVCADWAVQQHVPALAPLRAARSSTSGASHPDEASFHSAHSRGRVPKHQSKRSQKLSHVISQLVSAIGYSERRSERGKRKRKGSYQDGDQECATC